MWTIEPERATVRGVDQNFSFRIALAEIGGASYELITPHLGESVYDEHLAQHGNGFHHTCMVYPSMDAVREAKDALLSDGRTMLQEGGGGDVFEFAYFEFPEIGVPIELLFLDPDQLPPPEAVI